MRTKSRLSTTTRRTPSRKVQAPIHPGEVLAEDFLRPLGITQYRLAKGTRVPPRRINEIVHGFRAVTVDTSLRLARFFGTPEQFWLNLQTRFDLEKERDRLGEALLRDVEVCKAVATARFDGRTERPGRMSRGDWRIPLAIRSRRPHRSAQRRARGV